MTALPPSVPGLRLDVLVTGAISIEGKAMLDPTRPEVSAAERERRFVPVLAYLIHHPTAGNFLVDTGFGPAFVGKPHGDLGWYTAASVKVRLGAGEDVVSELARHGVTRGELKAVILTHAHVDHAGGLAALGPLPVILAKDELRMLDAKFPLLEGVKSSHFAQVASFQTVDFDAALETPLLGRAVDILGDGSVWLLNTRGHTPGHLSVLVNLPRGPELIAGDAVQTRHALADAIASGHSWNQPLANAAALWIRDLARKLHARVWCGHDADDAEDARRLSLEGVRP